MIAVYCSVHCKNNILFFDFQKNDFIKYCHVFDIFSWEITHFSTDITQISFSGISKVVAYLNSLVIKKRDFSSDNSQTSKCISDPQCPVFTYKPYYNAGSKVLLSP